MSAVKPSALVVGALPVACAECPWRLSNQGTPHPHGFYAAANLRRLWNGLRTGEAPGMTCHRMTEWPGYEDTEGRDAHECRGSLILLVREVMRFQAITIAVEAETHAGVKLPRGEGLRRYRAAAPRGLTRGALAEIVWRFVVGGSPLARAIQCDSRQLDDPDVGYPPLGVWDPAITAASQRR